MGKQTIGDIVKEANEIHRRMKSDGERLNELKDKIRACAIKESKDSGTKIVFTSDGGGDVEVVFVSDKCVLKKGANPHTLHRELPDETWAHLFAEKVTLSDEFEDALKLLPKDQQTKVKALVEWKPQEPRVALDR